MSHAPSSRLSSLDALRGLVMVVMALDHTRDFFSNSAVLFDPTDLSKTNPALFFTRWITHFCAPVFVFLAGTGAYLSLTRGKTVADVSRFLWTRGLWLMFLEVAVITPLGWAFSFRYVFVRLQVIWVIGLSMVILAGVIRLLPSRWTGAVGALLIAGHNLFDGMGGVTHTMTFLQPAPGHFVASLYPVIPWVGVLMAGYGAGEIMKNEPGTRNRIAVRAGLAMIAMFLILRGLNVYGDPSRWSVQTTLVGSALSFLRCSKYPPSLLYLLMTLGPAAVLLGWLDRFPNWLSKPFITLGRVPLFYYLLHLPLLHGMAVVFSYVRYGQAPWLFQDLMFLRGTPWPLPKGYGYDLWVVYAVWIGAVVLLYPVCSWFAGVKSRNKSILLSYL